MDVKTTLTEFQRRFREAREAADRGESVVIASADGDYVFEKAGVTGNPFAGLAGVFGAVAMSPAAAPDQQKIRARLHAKSGRR